MQAKIDDILRLIRQVQEEPTPLEISCETGILIKREDLSHSGSHKFRAVALQMEAAKTREVIVPTSGNAGITAAYLAPLFGKEVWCFVGNNIDPAKAAIIQEYGGRLFQSARSVRYSGFVSKNRGLSRIRQSCDEEALLGYTSLAAEMAEQCPEADAIFNFSTSGTSTLGIFEGYRRLGKTCPELHLVQSGKSSGMALELMTDKPEFNAAFTGAGIGGLRRSRRHKQVLEAVRKSGGRGHYATASDIDSAEKVLGAVTSPEGLACYAKALQYHLEFPDKVIVVIFSGRLWPRAKAMPIFEACEDMFGSLPQA